MPSVNNLHSGKLLSLRLWMAARLGAEQHSASGPASKPSHIVRIEISFFLRQVEQTIYTTGC
jgi:hypothetical protein